MNTTKALGDRGEAAAAQYLRKRGCQLLASQWRCRYGELDLVARDRDGTICFVEVKLRSGSFAGLPREAVEGMPPGKREAFRLLPISRFLTMSVPGYPFRPEGEDWLAFALSCPAEYAGAPTFSYSNIPAYLVGLAAGITVLCFLWKKGKRLLFTLLALGLLLRQAEQAARRKEEGHV